jgi:hypothetical protein
MSAVSFFYPLEKNHLICVALSSELTILQAFAEPVVIECDLPLTAGIQFCLESNLHCDILAILRTQYSSNHGARLLA